MQFLSMCKAMSVQQNKRATILAAAETQFSQYGFRRTTMDDIARAAGVSRPSLYSYFNNKEEIFRGLSVDLFEESLMAARREMVGSRERADVEERIFAGLRAFHARVYGVLEATPHGAELMDASGQLSADIALSSAGKLETLLAQELEFAVSAGELNLKPVGCSEASTAELLRLAAVGLKQGAANFAEYQKKLKRFLPFFFAGLRTF